MCRVIYGHVDNYSLEWGKARSNKSETNNFIIYS